MAKASNIVSSIKTGSIAEELGIEPGDVLVSINGQAVEDIIDYKYLISDDYIEICIKKKCGEEWIFEVDKEYDEDMGIEFENPIIDKARSCANKCIFCFIDQLPEGMRKTLYFKDDDSRLSFLQGNFITLTNMSNKDIDRIIKYRISPLNISVHTTDPKLRVKMLGNKRAVNIFNILKKFTDNNIDINCQIVLCRDINDGENLIETIKDLFSLYPGIKNVAVVPVGITSFREKLFPLLPYDKESSIEVLDVIEKLQQDIYEKAGDVFVRAADEFYIMAERELKGPAHYGEYEQLEDGIGMVTYFLENIKDAIKDLKISSLKKEVSVITGASAYKYLIKAGKMIEQSISELKINIYEIKNNFFGNKITVTGLLTGKDIIEQLEGKELGQVLLIPSNLLKSGERVLLDDISVEDLEERLKTHIRVSSFDGKDFIQNICM